MLHPQPKHSTPQNLTEPPAASPTPIPGSSPIFASLEHEQPRQQPQVPQEYAHIPHGLQRRPSLNYKTALSQHGSFSGNRLEQEASGHVEKLSISPDSQPSASSSKEEEVPTIQVPEDSKPYLQHSSMGLDFVKSNEQFNVAYQGTRPTCYELHRERDEDLQKNNNNHNNLQRHKKSYMGLNTKDTGSHRCKKGWCYHSDQTVSNDQLSDDDAQHTRYHQSAGDCYPQCYEYTEFKRRMSYDWC